MKKIWSIIAVLFSLILILSLYFGNKIESSSLRNQSTGKVGFVEVYQNNIRSSIFAALITVGSFLLTLKTAILQRLKDGFDTKKYADRYLAHKESNPKVEYYGGLRRLGTALAYTIFMCFMSSLLQMSIGFISHASAVMLCLSFFVVSALLVLYLTKEMFAAHREWFAKIEEDRLKEISS